MERNVEKLEEALIDNLRLLKFQESQVAKDEKVVLTNDMFRTPNKVGFECVFYFLFHKLDSVKCAQVFRTCWKIFDKKQAMEFRKKCGLWIAEIAENEPETQLPKLPGSILVSPYGKKFCWLACKLSLHVLRTLGPPPEIVCLEPKLEDVFKRLVPESIERNGALYDEKREEHKVWEKEYKRVVDLNLEFIEELKMEKLELKSKIEEAEKELGNLDDVKEINGEEILIKLKKRWGFLQPIFEKEEARADFIPSILSADSENVLDFRKLDLVISDFLLERAGEVGLKQEDLENLHDKERNVNLKPYIRICNASLKLHLTDINKFLSKADDLTRSLRDNLKGHAIVSENMKELVEKLKHLQKDLKSSIEENSAFLTKNSQTSRFFVNYQMPQTPPHNFRPGESNESQHFSSFDFKTPRATASIWKKSVFELNNSLALTPEVAAIRTRVETPLSYTPFQRLVTELSTPKVPSCNNSNSELNLKNVASPKCFDLPREFSALFERHELLEEEFCANENVNDADPVEDMDNFLEKTLEDLRSQSPLQRFNYTKSTNNSHFLESLAEDNEESVFTEYSSLGLVSVDNNNSSFL